MRINSVVFSRYTTAELRTKYLSFSKIQFSLVKSLWRFRFSLYKVIPLKLYKKCQDCKVIITRCFINEFQTMGSDLYVTSNVIHWLVKVVCDDQVNISPWKVYICKDKLILDQRALKTMFLLWQLLLQMSSKNPKTWLVILRNV